MVRGQLKGALVFGMLMCSASVWGDDRLELHTGVRQDALQWSIAGVYEGRYSNLLSELTWKDVRSLNFGVNYYNSLDDAVGGYIKFDYSSIMDGKTQDSDYRGNNRTEEFNRSYSETDDGTMLDFSAALGPNFHLSREASSALVLRPMLGFSYSSQYFKMSKLHNVYPDEYTYKPIHSTYTSSWYGPFIAGELFATLRRGVQLNGGVGLHYGYYRGQGNWGLREDFQHPVSFKQDADSAVGKTLHLALEVQASKLWIVTYGFQYALWESGEGTDFTYFSDGSTGSTPFNGAKWSSYLLRIGIKRNL